MIVGCTKILMGNSLLTLLPSTLAFDKFVFKSGFYLSPADELVTWAHISKLESIIIFILSSTILI
jgi:hypothetical protein